MNLIMKFQNVGRIIVLKVCSNYKIEPDRKVQLTEQTRCDPQFFD